jgi:hypothetical protein
MKSTKIFYGTLLAATLAGVSGAYAAAPKSEITVLRGELQVQQGREWVTSSQVTPGTWVRANRSDTTLKMNGMSVRLEPGARVKVTPTSQGTKIDARDGRLYVKVNPAASCLVATAKNQVRAGESEFVLDAGTQERFYVLQGQAQLVKPTLAPQPVASWSKSKAVALDGPDVRRRAKNRRRFTQGEENKGKRIGEDAPPSSPTPAATQSPAYTPAPSPSYTPPPSPNPNPPQPPSNPPPAATGGSPWPWIGGALLAGGAGYGISRLVDNNDDNPVFFNNVIRPASP